MKILSISTMFPSENDPIFGIFVKRRLEALSEIVDLTVVSPRPYFPFLTLLKKYRIRKNTPKFEKLNENTDLFFPRFFSVPCILKPLDGIFVFLSLYFFIKKLIKQGHKFDLLDAHLAFPEGFAAIWLGKCFRIPVTITLRGHDVNHLPKYPVRKKQVIYSLTKATKIFSVANALRLQAGKLGIDLDKIVVASNGVKTDLFYPMNQKQVRKELCIDPESKIILSIGYLIPRKGFDLIIDALKIIHIKYKYTKVKLVIIGSRGGEAYIKDDLLDQIKRLELQEYVTFIDQQRNEDLGQWYNIADLFCLASSHEGWPNVILEALACSVPVVAANVWGIPEIIGHDDKLGIVVERSPEPIAKAINTALDTKWDKNHIRQFAESKTWDKTAQLIKKEMQTCIKKFSKKD